MGAMLKKIAHHPAMNVAVGIIMIVSALGEMAGESMGIKLGAEHGLFAIGLLHTLKALPELAEGAAKIALAKEEANAPEPRARDTDVGS